MDEEGVMETARSIRPYLPTLVGSAADELDRRIAELLNANGDVRAALVSVLESYETTEDFLTEVLGDAPHFRPPELQTDHIRGGGGLEYRALPSDVTPVMHSGRYACPQRDYVWYRRTVGTPIPACPTHGSGLNRT